MYEIVSKSDFTTGASLVVRIPEEELDKKALYTILAEQPEFLLPFRHIIVDGQIEFTYQIGNRSKLAYLSGNRSPVDYADLWFNILHPLLNCDDLFMNPYSFVLKPDYLYCDNNKTIYFVYIPSLRACSDYNELKSMVTDVARQNHVTDVTLENKVVWAIQDFNLADFLQMLRPYRGYAAPQGDAAQGAPGHAAYSSAPQYQQVPAQGAPQYAPPPPPAPHPAPAPPQQPQQAAKSGLFKSSGKQQAAGQQVVASAPPPPPAPKGMPGDISIEFPPDGKEGKKEKAQKEPKPKKEKEEKAPKEQKEKGGLFGKKNSPQQEIIQGAAAMPMQQAPMQQAPMQQPMQPVQPMQQPMYAPPAQGMYDDGATQIDLRETGGPKFRYVGNGAHPGMISVPIAPGGMFTIGRFDPASGPGQSSFEFTKDTKAVSRRHAVVERHAEGFMLIDLNSSAGTFINGQKIPPNTPCRLEKGSRISFGYSGADYTWEE